MRTTIAMCAVLGVVSLGGTAHAADDLDSPKADPEHHKVEFENEWVRVVRWSVPAHEKTALHDHPNLVNVYLTDGDLKIHAPDGKVSDAHVKAGSAVWRGPTVHIAENVGDKPVGGILVEPKGPGNPAWKPPKNDAAADAHHKVEIDNDQVRVVRYSFGKGESVPMHAHPAGVQIRLTDADVMQTLPGKKAAESKGKAGEVGWRPAISHAIKNRGDRFEGILVDIKAAPAAR